MSRTTALSSFFVLVLVACGGSTPPPDSPVSSSSGAENPGGGEPACNFVVAGKCFADAASACKSAGCEGDKCLQAETHPVQVSCKK